MANTDHDQHFFGQVVQKALIEKDEVLSLPIIYDQYRNLLQSYLK